MFAQQIRRNEEWAYLEQLCFGGLSLSPAGFMFLSVCSCIKSSILFGNVTFYPSHKLHKTSEEKVGMIVKRERKEKNLNGGEEQKLYFCLPWWHLLICQKHPQNGRTKSLFFCSVFLACMSTMVMHYHTLPAISCSSNTLKIIALLVSIECHVNTTPQTGGTEKLFEKN